MLGGREQFTDGRAFNDFAGIHHGDLVAHFGDDAEIVGDQNDRSAACGLQLAHQIENLRLQGDIERGGRLVRDQEFWIASERHRDHHTLAHAAGKLVRVFVDALFGRGDVHAAQQLDRARPRLAPRAAAMAQDSLDDLVADRKARIERSHRLLKDHRQAIAAQVAQGFVGRFQQIETIKLDRAGNVSGMFREQAHDRERRHAFAAAGFADQSQRGAVGDR